MKKEKIEYICDRCGKKMGDEGTQIKLPENVFPYGYRLIPTKQAGKRGWKLWQESPESFSPMPDLCDECYESLQNWFSNKNYIEADQKWNLSEDVERLDTALKLIVGIISGDQFFENLTEEEIVQYWMDEADKYLEKERNS